MLPLTIAFFDQNCKKVSNTSSALNYKKILVFSPAMLKKNRLLYMKRFLVNYGLSSD